MTLQNVDQILEHAASLTPSERLLLASRLIQGVRKELPDQQPQRLWHEVAGLLSYPSLGEDAQSYISHSRRTANEHRLHIIQDGE